MTGVFSFKKILFLVAIFLTPVFVFAVTTEIVSVNDLGVHGNGSSYSPDISSNGRYVVFQSDSTNLVSGDTNGVSDIFVYDRDTNTIERVSVDDIGNEGDGLSQNARVSSDGRYVAFQSASTNLVSGDTNGVSDIFVYDRDTNTIERVSVDDIGTEANASSSTPSLSSDGRYVAFLSSATNLITGVNPSTVFVYDRDTNTIEQANVSSSEVQGNQSAYETPAISGDGRFVSFFSGDSNLVSNDTNGAIDVFVRDTELGLTERISVSFDGSQGNNGTSSYPRLSDDGLFVVFHSTKDNLVSGGSSGLQIFVRVRNQTPTNITLSNNSIPENESIGTVVGALTTTDADVSDTHTYTLACTSPGADDASFSISGGNLLSAQSFNYEDITSYSICIKTDDGNGGTYDKNFTITITDVSDSSSSGSSGSGPSNPVVVNGCTDSSALNFLSSAEVDNGSCIYAPAPVPGCMDSSALNYNSLATTDNNSCSYPPPVIPVVPVTPITPEVIPDVPDTPIEEDPFTPPAVEETSPVEKENILGEENYNKNNFYFDIEIQDVKEITEPLSVAGVVLPALIFIVTQPAVAASIPIRLWSVFPTLLGFKRRKRPWGTVYDSVTKQPLDPVHVTLFDEFGKEVTTSITDIDGRFGFLVPAGKYKIFAQKDNYEFPSKKIFGKERDELYGDLYFNELVEIKSEEDILIKNIPMDAVNFNWNEFEKSNNKQLMKFYSKRELFFANISSVTFYAGVVSSLFLMFTAPAPINFIIFGVYVLVFILRLFGVRPKKPGYVYDELGYPLSFGIVKIFSTSLNREIAHSVIGKTGKYYTLVPNGDYFMKILKKTGEDQYLEVYTTDSFKVSGGYIKEKIKIN